LKHKGYNNNVSSTNPAQKYKFNGIELEEGLDLNLYEMDYRQYDNTIGRFIAIDPLAEIRPDWTPYRFGGNNPIYFSDPSGLIEQSVLNEMFDRSGNGSTMWNNDGYSGFTTEDGGYVGYTSGDTSFNTSPGEVTSLPAVTVSTHKGWNTSYAVAALQTESNIYGTKWYNRYYGQSGNGGAYDSFLGAIDKVNQYNPFAHAMDVLSYAFSGSDRFGNNMSQGQAYGSAFSVSPVMRVGGAGTVNNIWKVGPYNKMRGMQPGLDAHHVGQAAGMKRMIPGYDRNTAPTILVPKVRHTIRGSRGIVSRSLKGIKNPRQLMARDIFELRRVYPNIPNKALRQLINENKRMYPGAFKK